jgi:uncharacterized membrane protein YphA (DoxX/SURF4 family)
MPTSPMTQTSTLMPDTAERAAPAGPGLVVDDTENISFAETAARPRWSVATRVLFRFCVLYFGLYILTTQMYWGFARIVPWVTMPYLRQSEWVQKFTTYIAHSWWGFPLPLSTNQGSGDKPFDWALACAVLIVSVAATAVWSAVDWRRQAYPGLQKWFRLVLRLGLATTMVGYGMAKFFPLQMSYPGLTRMLQPYGTFSLMGVLWTKIGASPLYEIFTGTAELLMAVLLFIPGLTTIGALMGLAVSTQIWVLNMTYDVPVKLFSFHLILMCLVLLAPDVRRLVNFLILKRPTEPPTEPPLVKNRIGRRIAIAAQLAFGAWMLWGAYSSSKIAYSNSPTVAARPPLYGIWTIDRMTIDGVERAPLLTDYDRWRRVVVQSPVSISFQRMDDTFSSYGTKVDMAAKNIALMMGQKPAGNLKIEQPAPGKLIMDGDISGRRIRIESTLFDHSKWNMVNSRFRWVQDMPFNR